MGGGQQCGGQAGGSRPPRTRRRPREEQEGSEGADVLGGGQSRKRQKADTLGEFLSRKMHDAEEATQRRCSRCTCRISLRSSGGRAHARTQHAPYCLRRLPKDTAGRPLRGFPPLLACCEDGAGGRMTDGWAHGKSHGCVDKVMDEQLEKSPDGICP